jgi:hypothetical protein
MHLQLSSGWPQTIQRNCLYSMANASLSQSNSHPAILLPTTGKIKPRLPTRAPKGGPLARYRSGIAGLRFWGIKGMRRQPGQSPGDFDLCSPVSSKPSCRILFPTTPVYDRGDANSRTHQADQPKNGIALIITGIVNPDHTQRTKGATTIKGTTIGQ